MCAQVLILHLIYTLLQHGKARYFHMETVLDFLTLPPLFAQLDMGGGQNPFSSWMTVSYLRAYRILNSAQKTQRADSEKRREKHEKRKRIQGRRRPSVRPCSRLSLSLSLSLVVGAYAVALCV